MKNSKRFHGCTAVTALFRRRAVRERRWWCFWETAEDPGQCGLLCIQPHAVVGGSAGAAVFSGALIYAIHAEEILAKHPRGGSFGYCFALAWVAFPLALVSGIVYIHLRKRE